MELEVRRLCKQVWDGILESGVYTLSCGQSILIHDDGSYEKI